MKIQMVEVELQEIEAEVEREVEVQEIREVKEEETPENQLDKVMVE